MAIWTVPAATSVELNTIIGNNEVVDGEIVFDVGNHTILVGVVTDPGNAPGVGTYQTVVGEGQITNALVANNTIELTKMASIDARTVVANATTGSAAPTAVTLGINDVLTATDSGIVSGKISDTHIQAAGLALTSLAETTGFTVIANPASSDARPSAVSIGQDRILGRSGTGDIEGTRVVTNHITDRNVTFAKLPDVAPGTILGRSDTESNNGPVTALNTAAIRAATGIGADTAQGVTLGNDGTITVQDATDTAKGVATFDENDFTVTAGDVALNSGSTGARGLFNGTNGVDYDADTGTFTHANTSSQADIAAAANTFFTGMTFDSLGHVQTVATQTLQQGNGISLAADGTISVTATHAAETFTFPSIAARNAARAQGWQQGDIAIVTTAVGTESFIYHGAQGNTSATTAADWAELSFSSGENTTYSFASGTNGGFTVTPSIGGVAQTAVPVTVGHVGITAAQSSNNSGTAVIQDVTVDTNGHVTGFGTVTLANVAGSGSYNDLINTPPIPTNTNQLTNGNGFVTSSGVTSVATNSGLTGGIITGTGTIGIAQNGITNTHINQSTTYSAANWCLASDERLKENIETICCGLDKVKAMRGVSYTKDGEAQVGVVAQEVEKVVPEVVFEGEDGYKSVAYSQLVGVLIEAVKDLSAQVEELKNGTSR